MRRRHPNPARLLGGLQRESRRKRRRAQIIAVAVVASAFPAALARSSLLSFRLSFSLFLSACLCPHTSAARHFEQTSILRRHRRVRRLFLRRRRRRRCRRLFAFRMHMCVVTCRRFLLSDLTTTDDWQSAGVVGVFVRSASLLQVQIVLIRFSYKYQDHANESSFD